MTRFLTKAALAALLVGTMGVSGLVPALADDATVTPGTTAAQPAAPATDEQFAKADENGPGQIGPGGHFGPRGFMLRRGGREASILNLACGDRGAEALEIGLVHLNYTVKPTAEQQPLFDALKTSALADQKTFAESCKTAMGTDPAKATIVDRMQSRLTIDNARVTALNDVLPKFKAFYDSLTTDQKAKLEPKAGGPRVGFNGPWAQHQGWHRMGGPGMHRPMGGMNGPGAAQPTDDANPPMPDDQGMQGADDSAT